jgi:hypothetical protein
MYIFYVYILCIYFMYIFYVYILCIYILCCVYIYTDLLDSDLFFVIYIPDIYPIHTRYI